MPDALLFEHLRLVVNPRILIIGVHADAGGASAADEALATMMDCTAYECSMVFVE
jgi:hypothetical protein